MSEKPAPSDGPHPRWSFLRDVAVFQVKLLVDGLRDLIMSPISLGAALAGLLADPDDPGRLFRRLLHFGQRSERWINLFGHRVSGDRPGIDDLFGQLERRIVEQYEKGGATASAKQMVDRSLDGLNRRLDSIRERVEGGQHQGEPDPADPPDPTDSPDPPRR